MNFPQDIFKDLKVIEFASVLAGPAVGMFFAELGAQVVKVENKTTGGDVTRTWKLKNENTEESISSYFSAINYGKECIQLDLKSDEDRKQVEDLIADADILISNFKHSSALKLGLSFDQLKDKYPSLIYAQLDAFGASSNRLAYDVILQAETGFLSMSGTADGELCKMPVALIDVLAAHQLKEGILVALYQRLQKGKGQMVRTSLFAAAIASLVNQASGYLMTGHLPIPMGTQHPNIAPYGDIFKSKDDKAIILAIGSNSQFEKLCTLIGATSLYKEKSFASNQSRLLNRSAMVELLQEKIVLFNQMDFLSKCHQLGIPAGAINNLKQVFESKTSHPFILKEEQEGITMKMVRSVVFELIE